MENETVSKNFIEQMIDKDIEEGYCHEVHTRFPPEPNGYLHIGHAKSILLNYGLAQKYGGKFNLRFDDTNPTKEKTEFVEAIQSDIEWLGADWEGRLFFASDYFEQMYEGAVKLIKKGKAYVSDLSAEQIREYRGTLTESGKEDPYSTRSVEENLALFEDMKNGKFADGEKVLRARIDMASSNINMRDPVIYRVAHVSHHRTGDTWCIYPMYDFAQKIGGDKVTVTNMVPAGTEPHDWEPSTTDITNLEDADVFIYSGAGMEHWVDSVLGSLTNQDLDVVQASDGITLREGYEDEDGDVGADPHVWLAPANAKIEMKNITDVLCSADPANAEYYRQNYEQWALECDRLDTEFTEALSALPNKNIVVSHEAFGYLCDAYGLNQVGIEGIEADSEPDPARMAEIEDFVKANNVKVIFSEELVSPKVAQTIADATGAQMQELNPLEGLTDDQIADGQDYFTVMRQNLEELKNALQ